LADHRVQAALYLVHTLRKKMGLCWCCSKQKRKFKVTTDSKYHLSVAPNVLKREFAVSTPHVTRAHFYSKRTAGFIMLLLFEFQKLHDAFFLQSIL